MSTTMRSGERVGVVDGARTYAARTSSPLPDDDADARAAVLRQRAADGFATSAYWGVTGRLAAREPDDVTGKQPYRFAGELSSKLVPVPATATSIPRVVDYTLCGMHVTRNKGVGVSDRGGLNASQLRTLADAMASDDGDTARATATGTTKTGKPPFLSPPLSTTHRSMRDAFDADVRRAADAGDAHDAAQRARLAALQSTPLPRNDADAYRLTSDDYCDLSRLDPAVARVTECVLDAHNDDGSRGRTRRDDGEASARGGDDGGAVVYRSRYNNVERNGPRRRARAAAELQREGGVDVDALRDALHAMRAAARPAHYTPACTDDWLSTTHREHAAYDVAAARASNDANATVPLRNVHYTRTCDAREASAAGDNDDKDGGSNVRDAWASEYRARYDERTAAAARRVRPAYGVPRVFDVRDGVYTIDHHYHHPRSDTTTHEAYTPAQLVPGQYATMSQQPLHLRNALPSSRS